MGEEEVEFSFKDLAVYCLKKWFIIVAAAVIGLIAGIVVPMLTNATSESYRVSAEFCSFSTYIANNEDLKEADYALTSYSSVATGAMKTMSSDACIALFIKSDAFSENAAKAFPEASIETEKDRQSLFNTAFEVVSKDNGFNVGIEGVFDTDAKRDGAKNLLRSYAAFARDNIVYVSNKALAQYTDDDGNVVGAITVSEPFYYISAENDGSGLLKNAIMGVVIGAVAGVVIVVIIYCADPRVKSVSSLAYVGEIVAKTKADELKSDAVSRIAGKTKNAKMLLVASPENNAFTGVLSKAVARELASAGLKTLYVNFSALGDGGDIAEFFAGKDISDVVKTDDGIDCAGISDRRDALALIAKKDRFASLKDAYDKIIVAYSDYSDGGAIALGDVADGTLFVINQKVTRLNALNALVSDVGGAENAVGAYVHNSI